MVYLKQDIEESLTYVVEEYLSLDLVRIQEARLYCFVLIVLSLTFGLVCSYRARKQIFLSKIFV